MGGEEDPRRLKLSCSCLCNFMRKQTKTKKTQPKNMVDQSAFQDGKKRKNT